jgi:hypothetical protein
MPTIAEFIGGVLMGTVAFVAFIGFLAVSWIIYCYKCEGSDSHGEDETNDRNADSDI